MMVATVIVLTVSFFWYVDGLCR